MKAKKTRILLVIAIVIALLTTMVVVMAYIPQSPVSRYIEDRRIEKLLSACSTGDVKTVERLLQRYPYLVSSWDRRRGWYPIAFAVRNDHIDVVDILLRHGADINVKGPGNPLIFRALDLRNPVLLHELLQRHANIEARNIFGDSLLHTAVNYKDQECMKVLITAGIDVNIIDNIGQTPLHLAVSGCNIDIIKMLLNSGARTDIADKFGSTPMDINERWPDEKTPLIRSILSGEEL